MASTEKTSHLGLNRWLGPDMPKRDDFNKDNQIVDTACLGLSADLAAAVTAAGAARDSVAALDVKCGRLAGSIATHADNGAIHITAAERDRWNSRAGGGFIGPGEPAGPGSTMTMGSYVGNGKNQRTIDMGGTPRFGLLYAADQCPVNSEIMEGYSDVFFGFFGQGGCSKSIALSPEGITVDHNSMNALNGSSIRYNKSGVTYVYVLF